MSVNNVESLSALYTQATNQNGNVLGNESGIASVTYSDDQLLFTENDGDVIAVAAGEVSDEVLAALGKEFGINITKKSTAANEDTTANVTAEATAAVEEASSTAAEASSKATSAEVSAAKAEIETSKTKINEDKDKIEDLKASTESIEAAIKTLSDEIEKSISDILKQQKEITEEEEERINTVIQEEVERYKNDVKAGKSVDIEELDSRIKVGLANSGFDADMQALIGKLFTTNAKITQMETLLGQLSGITKQISDLDSEINTLEDKISGLEDFCEENEDCEPPVKKHDPMGFTSDGVTYEFVVDRDGNNALTDVSEFLGAEDNFDEMTALDADGSKDVSKEELSSAGVKVLVKDAEGNQSLKTLEEAFGDADISVDLDSYQDFTGQGKTGENGQELLGNFNVNLGDETIEAYATNDTEDYLKDNYTFTSEDPTNVKSAIHTDVEKTSNELDAFVQIYTEKLNQFKESFNSALKAYNLDTELIETLKEFGGSAGEAEAKILLDELETKEDEEAEEADEADEAEEVDALDDPEEAEEADDTDEVEEDDKDKDKDED